jgi:hypothetical protein
LLVSNWGTNLVEISHMFKSSVRIHWHVPYKRSNLRAISKMVLHWSLLVILQTFSAFSSVLPDELNAHNFRMKFPHTWIKKNTQNCVFSLWHCHQKLFRVFHAFLMQFSPSLKTHWSFKSAIRKSWIALNRCNNKHPLRSNIEGYGGQTP